MDGHNFNVFQIGLSGTGTGAGAGASPVAGVAQELTYRHLYKLVRGVTNATIQVIPSFLLLPLSLFLLFILVFGFVLFSLLLLGHLL